MITTLSQQHFSFQDFPDDRQLIKIRYGSFGYGNDLLAMVLTTDPVSFVPNVGTAAGSVGEFNFFLHSEWLFKKEDMEYGQYPTLPQITQHL
jgi:hypothetical protein